MNLSSFISEKLQTIQPGQITHLTQPTDMRESWHRWTAQQIDALVLALVTETPLLVRGEPGTGKSQLARAVANVLDWQLHTAVVHANLESSDLFYRYDAVRRLADAQALEKGGTLGAPEVYLSPGPLWDALNSTSANDQRKVCGPPLTNSVAAKDENPHVLLIDEIDKADSGFANALLEVLGERSFRHPFSNERITPLYGIFPLVIITTNEDRPMPAPFLRRCLVLDMDTRAHNTSYVDHLVSIGDCHFGEHGARPAKLSSDILTAAAELLAKDRQALEEADLAPPGPAEYLSLLAGLYELAPGTSPEVQAVQRQWLIRLADYSLIKHARLDLPANLRQGSRQQEAASLGHASPAGA